MNGRSIILITFLFVLAVFSWSCSSGPPNQDNRSSEAAGPAPRLDPYSAPLYPAQKRAEAEDFNVQLVNGESFQLSRQKGKVVLLNIWATWCAPCREETPELVDLYAEYRDQGLEILGVSVDKQGESVVKPFMEKYEVNYPVVIDDDDIIMDKYGPTMGIPTTYIIGKDGTLRYFAVGAVTIKELEPRIQKLLDET